MYAAVHSSAWEAVSRKKNRFIFHVDPLFHLTVDFQTGCNDFALSGRVVCFSRVVFSMAQER